MFEKKSPALPIDPEELRARLETLCSLGGVIGRGELAPDQRRALEALVSSVEGLERRMNGRRCVELTVPEVVDPIQILDETLAELGARAALRGIELVADVDPRTPARVAVDPGALREGLRELVGQALRRAEGSDVVLRLAVVHSTSKEVVLSLCVTDGGSPLAPKDAQRMVRGGDRAGLAWCVALMEENQGSLDVEPSQNEDGNRVRWTLRLPILATSRISKDGPLQDVRVLVVDDNKNMRAASLRLLESFGCRVSTADSVTRALSACSEAASEGDPVRLALVDIRMPGRGGFHLPQELAQAGLPLPGLVLVYANHRSGDLPEAKRIGFRAALRKPLKTAELEATLTSLLCEDEAHRRSA